MATVGLSANIKYILQKFVFSESNEKVLSVCTVTKSYKNKKLYYLCITSALLSHNIFIYQVKHHDNANEYKTKRRWDLNDLKFIDGKSNGSESYEFDIYLDKLYKWYAINMHERQNFLGLLYKHINKHASTNFVEFRNIPACWFEEKFKENEKDEIKSQISDEEDYDIDTLSEKEILNLNTLIKECNFTVRGAEYFIEQLGNKLQNLDAENIKSVLASKEQVITLLSGIEKAIKKVEHFETRLNCYDEVLGHIKETMEKLGGKTATIEIANNNNIRLLNKLNIMINQLDFPCEYQFLLVDADLKTSVGRDAAIAAGKLLQNAMNFNIDPALFRLTAVQDQRKKFEKWKIKFSQIISRYLNNLFIHLGNDIGEEQYQSTEIKLPAHCAVHKELLVYTELMMWIKAMDRKAYDGLIKVYTNSLSKIYERDLKHFFTQGRQLLTSSIVNYKEDLDNYIAKNKSTNSKQMSVPYGLLGVNKEFWTFGIESSDREKLDMILEKVLTDLEPVALEEQIFCINFFQLDTINHPTSHVDATSINQDYDLGALSSKKIDRHINEEVRKMMMSLFSVLESELIGLIQSFEKVDSFYCMYVLVRLTQHVMSAQDTHSFLSMTYASALIQVKRNFDRFMSLQLQSVKDSKVPKRSKCGILCYVENFEEFTNITEEIFKKSDRRTDIDKWYVQLVNTIFEYIRIHAEEHPKTPSQVIQMENYHHLYCLLSQLKLPVLESFKKESKMRYNEALKAYVIKYFGRPLEKLNLFFEGVQQKVAQGVKEVEISYQMAFSKQELRKVISQYPAREVKRGLENLYKKVEKHLCEEENLLQVVWHAMQEEFIAQYNFLEERIQKCYAGAMISLEFNIHDILTFFSDIARSH